MKPYHHRAPSLVGLLASECVARTIYFGIIVDGLHVHDSAVRIAYRTNRHGMVLVSDACAALGVGDGRHSIGGTEIDVRFSLKIHVKNCIVLPGLRRTRYKSR